MTGGSWWNRFETPILDDIIFKTNGYSRRHLPVPRPPSPLLTDRALLLSLLLLARVRLRDLFSFEGWRICVRPTREPIEMGQTAHGGKVYHADLLHYSVRCWCPACWTPRFFSAENGEYLPLLGNREVASGSSFPESCHGVPFLSMTLKNLNFPTALVCRKGGRNCVWVIF